jgi:outer membrane biosynthesis protein TonB
VALYKPTPQPRPKTPPRAQPVEPGYQPQREETRIEGSISNRGKRGVDAIGTPLGRYRKLIADAIGSRWYHYINRRMDLITVGSARIKFYVDERGEIQDVKLLSNTANDTFAGFSVQSILEAKIPPPPPDVTEKLDNNRLEVEYTFTIYPN